MCICYENQEDILGFYAEDQTSRVLAEHPSVFPYVRALYLYSCLAHELAKPKH